MTLLHHFDWFIDSILRFSFLPFGSFVALIIRSWLYSVVYIQTVKEVKSNMRLTIYFYPYAFTVMINVKKYVVFAPPLTRRPLETTTPPEISLLENGRTDGWMFNFLDRLQ